MVIPGFNLSPKTIGYGVAGIVAVICLTAAVMHYRGLVSDRDDFKAERDNLRAWQIDIVRVTSRSVGAVDEDGRDALIDESQVADQIEAMGDGLDLLQNAVGDQNSDIARRAADLEERTKSAERDAERLRRRAERGDALIARLQAEAALPGDQRCIADPEFVESLGDL